MGEYIELGHGNGGIMTHALIRDLFLRHFGDSHSDHSEDSALLHIGNGEIAFTTDSFVVTPVFFPGGNIGKLAVCGTVNDLVVAGAVPKYLSCGFIIEEGLPIAELEAIVKSMAETATVAGVQIVTGDTKVVERGKADKVYINTTGIGEIKAKTTSKVSVGDKIIVTGTLGDHGAAILLARESMDVGAVIPSDCAPLSGLLLPVWERFGSHIKLMKDPTRGGLATTLNEIVSGMNYGMQIEESKIPTDKAVKSVCAMLGLDPLYLANEGKAIIIVQDGFEDEVVELLKTNALGKNSTVIGEITEAADGKVVLKTEIGTTRLLNMLYADQLPRIC